MEKLALAVIECQVRCVPEPWYGVSGEWPFTVTGRRQTRSSASAVVRQCIVQTM